MPSTAIPVILLQGSPLERGRQHGTVFADAIRAALERLRDATPAPSLEEARGRAARSWSILTERAPDVAAEVHGLAEGSGSGLLDVYLHIGFEFFPEPPPTGCSAIAVRGGAGAIVGQNWDAPKEAASELALFLHVGPDGFERALVASVGTLGWVGCNRHGLCLVNNDLMLDRAQDGLPSQVVRRIALAQPNVPAALRVLHDLPHMGGRCYLLGDAAGAIAGVEVSPSTGARPLPRADRIAHTNHATLPETQVVEDGRALQRTYPSSRWRLEGLNRFSAGSPTAAGVMRVLRDRDGAPNAISKSLSPDEATQTAFSIVFDCAAGNLHLCTGLPSSGPFTTFRLLEAFLSQACGGGSSDGSFRAAR